MSMPSRTLFLSNTRLTPPLPSLFPREQSLMKEALILAKQKDVDVVNALDLMENQEFLKDLKFGPGDGTLHYYVYNWGCAEIESSKVGLVLL